MFRLSPNARPFNKLRHKFDEKSSWKLYEVNAEVLNFLKIQLSMFLETFMSFFRCRAVKHEYCLFIIYNSISVFQQWSNLLTFILMSGFLNNPILHILHPHFLRTSEYLSIIVLLILFTITIRYLSKVILYDFLYSLPNKLPILTLIAFFIAFE